jgi:hypothetical protein
MTARKVTFDHTDPGLRPFIEVEAKIVLDVFQEARAAKTPARELVRNVADTATSDAEQGAREMSEQVPILRRLTLACTAGCSYCCYGSVFASTPEILRIADFLKETRTPEQLSTLRAHAEATAVRVAPLDIEGRAAARIPCPLARITRATSSPARRRSTPATRTRSSPSTRRSSTSRTRTRSA